MKSCTNVLQRDLNRARVIPGKHNAIDGLEQLDKVIAIDQSPIEEHQDQTRQPIREYLISSVTFCIYSRRKSTWLQKRKIQFQCERRTL